MYSTHARMVPGSSMARACPAASPRHVCVRAVKKPQPAESAPNHLQALGIMMGTAALLATGPADASFLPFGNNTNQAVQQVKATPKSLDNKVAPSVYSTNEVMSVSIVPNSLEELDDKVNKSLEESQSGPASAPIKPGQELRPGAALESVQAKLPLKPEAGKDDSTLISKPVGNGTGEPTSAGPQTPEGVEGAKAFLKSFMQQGNMTFALMPNSLEELDDKVNKSLEESQSGPASAPVQPGIELRPGAGTESTQAQLPLKKGSTTISQPVGNGSGEPTSDKSASNAEPVGPDFGPARVNGPSSIAGIPLNSGEPVSAGPVKVGGGGPTNPDGSVPTVAPGIKDFLSSFLRPGTMTLGLVPNSLEELDDKVNKSLEESQSGPASAPVQPGIELRPGAGTESTQAQLPLKSGSTTISQPVGNGSGEPTSDKSASNAEPVGPDFGPARVNGPSSIAGIPLNSGEPVSAGPVKVGGGGPTNADGSVPTVAPGIKDFLSSFLRPGDMNLTLGAMPNSLQELDDKVNASLKESDEGPATAPKKFGVPTRPSAAAESNPASLPLQGNPFSNFFKGIFGQGNMSAQFTPENKQV